MDVAADVLSPNVLTWVDYLPVLLVPPFIVIAVLLYGGVIPAGPGDRHVAARRGGRVPRLLVAGVSLSGWTLVWGFLALVMAGGSEDLDFSRQVHQVREPFGLLFAAVLTAWTTPFAVSAFRRRGWSWLLLAATAILIAGYLVVDLFAEPLYCGCN